MAFQTPITIREAVDEAAGGMAARALPDGGETRRLAGAELRGEEITGFLAFYESRARVMKSRLLSELGVPAADEAEAHGD